MNTLQLNILNIIFRSARISREIGKKIGDLLVQLTNLGLQPENLELAGISLGAHIVGFAAKQYYRMTGNKPSRITGLDPAGPCFRGLTKEHRLDSSDAVRVDVLHTNIDGFGIADRLGHVDFYANGGEFQPGDFPYIPCLVICSHIRSLIYFWQALEHPKKFIGIKCDSVQQARLAKCYNSTVTNYLGIETKFNKPGIYYLPTFYEFPYFRGRDGLRPENEIYKAITGKINDEDNLVIT